MDLQVIVPTYNNRAELEACLLALGRQHSCDFQVLVCVDGSSDGTLEYLRSASFPFRLSVLEHADRANHGRAAARNLALPHLTGSQVVFVDSDMRLEPNALERHTALLRRNDCVSIGDVVYENAGQNVWARYLGTRGRNKAQPGSPVRALDFVTANSGMRTEHLRALGGFDERLGAYGGEDTELALRLSRDRQIPFVFNAAARALTFESKTVEQGLDELRRYAAVNLREIRRAHPTGPAPFSIDRLESKSLDNRIFRGMLNPVVDSIVDLMFPHVPFAAQSRLLNYKVIRAVFAGYSEGVP